MKRHLVLACSVALLVGCAAGDEPGARPSPTPAAGFHVDGQYETAVTLAQSSCTGIAVEPNPTTVTHTAGAATLALQHAGQTYTGTVTAAGAFTTSPQAVAVGGSAHALSIVGAFSATGFQATVSALVSPQNCRYVVRWVGTKDGPPNVLG